MICSPDPTWDRCRWICGPATRRSPSSARMARVRHRRTPGPPIGEGRPCAAGPAPWHAARSQPFHPAPATRRAPLEGLHPAPRLRPYRPPARRARLRPDHARPHLRRPGRLGNPLEIFFAPKRSPSSAPPKRRAASAAPSSGISSATPSAARFFPSTQALQRPGHQAYPTRRGAREGRPGRDRDAGRRRSRP